MISPGFKAFIFGGTVMLSAACGAAGGAPATTTTDATAKPAAGAIKGASIPNACEAVAGKCTPVVAAVACKSEPAGLCSDDEICCVM